MEEEIDIFMAQIVRKGANQSWGLRIEGGTNTGRPLTISAVAPGSPAGSIGLQPGDIITKIFDRPTKFLTQQQAADIIAAVKKDTLTLTVERSANAAHDVHQSNANYQPEQQQLLVLDEPQQPQPIQQSHFSHYQPPTRHQEIQPHFQPSDGHPYHHQQQSPVPIVNHPGQNQDSQTFKGTMRINLSSPQSSTPPPIQTTFQPQKYLEEEDEAFSGAIPQSRTFRRLQNFMDNSPEPALGAAGLPPPRSASMEQMRQQQMKGQSQGRVKVIMAQKYNTPLGMYSADNVIDTFSTQVGSILHTLNSKPQ